MIVRCRRGNVLETALKACCDQQIWRSQAVKREHKKKLSPEEWGSILASVGQLTFTLKCNRSEQLGILAQEFLNDVDWVAFWFCSRGNTTSDAQPTLHSLDQQTIHCDSLWRCFADAWRVELLPAILRINPVPQSLTLPKAPKHLYFRNQFHGTTQQ